MGNLGGEMKSSMARGGRDGFAGACGVTAFVVVSIAIGLLTSVNALPEQRVELFEASLPSNTYEAAQLVNETAKVAKYWRTGFHFQPRKNWMNDPNGPMFYKGYYHLFYQYNPFAALWGNITWGHAVSTDLIHWKYLDDATIQGGPGWYDILGAWSGSSTFMKDGTPHMLYTGWSNVSTSFQIQTQNLVIPVDPSDPLLRYWYKSDSNPVIVAEPEPVMNASNFRDPTEGWIGKDGSWRILVGGKEPNGGGTAYVYKSEDFVNFTYLHTLHHVDGVGMWECPDFFPVAVAGKSGLAQSVNNGLVKHVLKVSLDNYKHDSFALGTYDIDTDTFKPDTASIDVGIGLRYDYGKFYASKSFFDQSTNRRILWGWINESTSDQNAVITGWSGLQAIPRQVWLDPKTQSDLIQWPIEEVNKLHRDKVAKKEFTLSSGTIVPVEGVFGAQLDIEVKFYKPQVNSNAGLLFDGTNAAALGAQQMCSQKGAAANGAYGPFGFLVLAAQDLTEQTALYFYIAVSPEGDYSAVFCTDHSRSSLQIGTDETTYGTYVKVLESEEYLTLRTLVDHSIVESFAQGGRTVITSRVYPTVAVDDAAQFFLFNNGTNDIEVHSFEAWKMANIDIVQFSG